MHVIKLGPSDLSVTHVSAQAKPYRLRINHTSNDKVPLAAVLIKNKWDAGHLQLPTIPVTRC